MLVAGSRCISSPAIPRAALPGYAQERARERGSERVDWAHTQLYYPKLSASSCAFYSTCDDTMFMGRGTLGISKRQPAIAFLSILRERFMPFGFNKNISAYLIIARRTVFLHIAFVNRRFHTLGVLTRLSSVLPRGLRNLSRNISLCMQAFYASCVSAYSP